MADDQSFIENKPEKPTMNFLAVDDDEPRVNKSLNKTLKTVCFVLGGIIVVVVLALAIWIATTLSTDKIHNNIWISGVDVSGLSYDDANRAVGNVISEKQSSLSFNLVYEDKSWNIKSADFDVSYDYADALGKAYAVGREGNIIQRFLNVLNVSKSKNDFPANVSYTAADVDSTIALAADEINKEPSDPTGDIVSPSSYAVTSGKSGVHVDTVALTEGIVNSFRTMSNSDIPVAAVIVTPQPFTVQSLYDFVYSEPSNAYPKQTSGLEYTIIGSSPGRKADMAILQPYCDTLNAKDSTKVVIPVIETTPTAGSATYTGKLFVDVLGTYSTSNIGANGSNRAFNIIYAASLLNGHIILPGETFSFNAVANNAAANNTFKLAGAYQDGRIVQSLGGGICQVSSTMYNAVLLADLQVVTRKNHSFMVGYVPLGRDATVSAGSQDFKFKNDTGMPIRFETSAGGGTIKITIKGTNEHPGKSVVITSNQYNMVPGNKMNGWTADAFKSIYQDGKLVSTVKISTSVYKPMIVDQPAVTPQPSPTPQPSQVPQTSPPPPPVSTPVPTALPE